MKKTIFSAAIFLTSIGVYAQLFIAPTVGYSQANSEITYPTFTEPASVNRFTAGVQLQKKLSEKFRLGLTLQYAGKGFKTRGADGAFNHWRYDYLELIPSVEYKPFAFMGIYAGPSIGYLFDLDFKNYDKWAEPFGTPIEATELAGEVGIKLYWKAVFLNFSYNRSLLSISAINFTDENGSKIEDAKEFNKSIRLGVGYNFQL